MWLLQWITEELQNQNWQQDIAHRAYRVAKRKEGKVRQMTIKKTSGEC